MQSIREILVIRENDCFSSVLTGRGFAVTNFPVIKTKPAEQLSELENLLAQVSGFDGIFITSSRAAKIVLAKLRETDAAFEGKFYVLGKSSNDLLAGSGYKTFFSRQATTAEELLAIIPETELKGKRFLFPRGNLSQRIIAKKLRNLAEVRETIVYKTSATERDGNQSDKIKNKLENGEYLAVCFFSPSGVENFLAKMNGDFDHSQTKIAVIGKTTARFAESVNLRVDFVAAQPVAEEFALELIDYLNSKGKQS